MIKFLTGPFTQRARINRIPTINSKRLKHSFQPKTILPVKQKDNHLSLVFDDQHLWKNLSKTSVDSVGFCGHPHFSSVQGIQFASQQAIQRSQILVERICNASINGEGEMKKVVKNLDRLSDTLCSVIDLAEFLRNSHPDSIIQESVHQAYIDLCSYMNTLNTDTRIHGILAQVLADKEIVKKFSIEEHKSALVLLHDFENSGIHLPDKKRKEFVKLSDRIIHLGRDFIQKNPQSVEKVKIHTSMLQENVIPKDYVSNGFAYIPTNSQYAHAILKYSRDRKLRKQMYQAMNSATNESVETLENLMKTRAELALLVGNNSFAELQLQDKMAKNPENVNMFLKTLLKHQEPIFKRDLQLLQSAKRIESKEHTVAAWDRDYYIRLYNDMCVKKRSTPIPHFTVGSVIQGLSQLFDHLYGVKFEYSPMKNGESWDDQIRKLNVICEKEGKIGTIYCDLFSRPGKTSHAAHYTIRTSRRVDDDDSHNDVFFAFPGRQIDESRLLPPIEQFASSVRSKKGLYQLPIIALTCDFAHDGNTAYLSVQEIDTLFHEMGHAMHSMLGRTDFHNVAGTRCTSDFVELPSILMEHFTSNSQVLSLFTDEPASVLDFKKNKSFDGLEINAQILMAMVDQSYHSSLANSNEFSSINEWNRIQNSVGLFPSVPDTMWPVQFNHLFGYASNYYSYLFDRTLARKVWENFKDNPLNRETGQAFREGVLEWGGSRDPWECVASVLGEEDASKIIHGDKEAMKTVGDWGLDVNKS